MNVPAKTKTDLILVGRDAAATEELRKLTASLGDIERMVFARTITVQEDKTGVAEDAVSVVTSSATAYIPLEELVDREKEIARLTAENEKMDREIARSNGMLGNPNFVNKAPAAKVEAERAKLVDYQNRKRQIEAQLQQYQGH